MRLSSKNQVTIPVVVLREIGVLRHKRVSDICDGNAIQGRQHSGQQAYRAE
jgi:hypothetical protein